MSRITFEELKTKYQSKLEKDNEVTCKLLAKLKDGYLVDINNEWEGFIPASHMNHSSEHDAQDSFQAMVISGPDKSDRYMVSPKALNEKSTYEKLTKLKEENKSLKVTISKVVKGGAEIYIDGARAFLPGRYIRLPGVSQDNWVNQEIEVMVEEIDYKQKKIILNHKKAQDVEKQKRAEATIQQLNEGDIVEAPVLRIADFGVFLDLGGLDGLVPASELSWGRFTHPKEVAKTGQILKAKIFRIEKDNLRVALSVKQLLGDPWNQIDHELETDQIVEGKVISEAQFGVFIQIKPGIEALLHNSEIPEGTEKPKTGKTLKVKVLKIDSEQRKIGLSLKGIEQENSSPITNENTNSAPNITSNSSSQSLDTAQEVEDPTLIAQ